MSIETDPVPPVPSHTPPVNKKDNLERFENNWTQWFVQLRDKINIINTLIVNLSNLTGNGIVVIQNSLNWFTRSLVQGSGITITNADGTAGDPTIAHADTSSVANLTSDNSNGVVIQDVTFTFDTFGHVTGATVGTVNLDGRYPLDSAVVHIAGDETIGGNKTFTGTPIFGSGTAIMSAAAGNNRSFRFQTSGVDRVVIGCDGTAESGANAGSNAFCNVYSDAGALLYTPFTIFRATQSIRWRCSFEFSATNTFDVGTSAFRVRQFHGGNYFQYGARLESGVVSPSQLTANTDNWAVTGLSTAAIIRASTDASRDLTGISSPTAGQAVLLCNVGSFDLVLVHDLTSTAANRFLCPGSVNFTLNPNDSVRLWYDSVSSRWRVIGV